MDTKLIDFLNICRTCLKQSANKQISIFSNINIRKNDHPKCHDMNNSVFKVVDIILFCASNISVNISAKNILDFSDCIGYFDRSTRLMNLQRKYVRSA